MEEIEFKVKTDM